MIPSFSYFLLLCFKYFTPSEFLNYDRVIYKAAEVKKIEGEGGGDAKGANAPFQIFAKGCAFITIKWKVNFEKTSTDGENCPQPDSLSEFQVKTFSYTRV